MVELIYFIGVVFAYLLFNSTVVNIKKRELESKPSPSLFHLTQLVVSFCSWPILIMFVCFVLPDKHLRKLWVFPLHFKLNPKW